MRNPTWDAAVLDAHRLVARAQKCFFLQWADGFDTYSTPSQQYETIGGSPVIGTSYRRFAPPSGLPGQGMSLPGAGYIRKNMGSNQQTLIPRLAYYQTAVPTQSTNIVGVLDAGTFQVNLVVAVDGSLHIYRAWATPYTSASLAATGPGVINPLHYYGIECLFGVSSSGGAAQVWVNGVQVINAAGLNTQQTSNAYAGQVQIGDTVNHGCYIDDFRVWDTTGASMNAPLTTDSRIMEKLPSAAGGFTGFTPNGAAANWQCVDDNPPDDDTTYVSGSAVSTEDAYTMPTAGFTAAPVMVAARSRARKDDGSTRTLQIGVLSSGTSGVGGAVTLGSTYAFTLVAIAQDPHTSAAWTAAGADAAQHWKNETA